MFECPIHSLLMIRLIKQIKDHTGGGIVSVIWAKIDH